MSKRLSIAVDETAKLKTNACKSRHNLNCNHHYVQCVDSWLFANDFTRFGSCVCFFCSLKTFYDIFSVILWILFCSKKKKKKFHTNTERINFKNIEFGSGECQHFENYFGLLEWQSYVIADANGLFFGVVECSSHCLSHSHSKWMFNCMWLYKYILITKVFYYFFLLTFWFIVAPVHTIAIITTTTTIIATTSTVH